MEKYEVTVHPVGLPHGPKPAALRAFMEGRHGEVHNEVGVMADFANPAWISKFALGLSEPGYMKSWGSYTTDAPFAWSASRLADVRALGERLAGARDALRPKDPEEGA